MSNQSPNTLAGWLQYFQQSDPHLATNPQTHVDYSVPDANLAMRMMGQQSMIDRLNRPAPNFFQGSQAPSYATPQQFQPQQSQQPQGNGPAQYLQSPQPGQQQSPINNFLLKLIGRY